MHNDFVLSSTQGSCTTIPCYSSSTQGSCIHRFRVTHLLLRAPVYNDFVFLIHGYKVFHVDKPPPTGRGGGSIMYVKNTLNPIERKSPATCTREIIQVDINSKNSYTPEIPRIVIHLKLVLIYRNPRITAADDDQFYTMLEEILLSQHECVIIGDFNLPNID